MEVVMSEKISLKEAERKVFRTSHNDGMLDIFLGCVFLMFVIAPFLSVKLGDFWSSAIFLPFWVLVYLGIRLIQKYVIIPRIGQVKFGALRVTRLKKFTLIMFIINFLALGLGVIAAFSFKQAGIKYPIILGITLLLGFSLAAYFLDMNRLYLYGMLTVPGPLVGEWLWQSGLASHHGYPVVFGFVSGVMIITGLVLLVLLLKRNPLPSEENAMGGV